MRKPKSSQSQGLLAGTAVGKAERNAEHRENRRTNRKRGSQPASQRSNFGEAQSIFLLKSGQGGGWIYVQLGMQQALLISLLKMQSVFTQ